MKPQLTFAFLLLFFTSALTAQVEFKVKLLTDNVTYQVLFRSNTTWSAPLNATSSAQVTVRVPTGGFSVGSVNGISGTWGLDSEVQAPAENPDYDYFIFGLQGATNAITYEEGEEVVVFEFTNDGSCTGAVELIDNENDPFTTNSMNIGINNTLVVIGAGIGQNAYLGNYGAISADCTPSSSCGIEIFDIILTPPSACGVADGSIEIIATTTGGLPLQYRINDTGPGSAYQPDPIFTGLAAGEEFEITVRDVAAICSVEAGTFELPGPLAAVVTGADIVQPDCDAANGSITINAVPQNGGVVEYGIGTPPVWQSSPTFTDLAEGTYTFFVQDIVNNCDGPAGTYTLTGCSEPECILTYDLEHLGDGVYQVNLTSDTTWLFPNNITSSMMVTLKVPTGGFVFDNLTSQVTDVNWTVGSTYVAPAEAPGYDYISVNMNSPGTQNIPYEQGVTAPLFTFENTGTCEGDSIFLMQTDDPFTANASANVGQQAFTTGSGEDIIPCLGNSTIVCESVPVGCAITYELEKTGPNTFQVAMIPDVTWNTPSNITSSFQVTIKVPTGGFDMTNLTSLVSGVNWSIGSTYLAPSEEPTYDYLTVTLNSPGTSNISYQTGVKVPLFTFENGGDCQDEDILLMDNDTDPFAVPNSQNANVGQQLFTVGSGEDVQACVINNPANDCNEDPCLGLTTSFTAADACLGESISFTSTTTSIETVTSWDWEFGDTPLGTSSDESPTYTYSSSGNFEVSLTVTTESGCIATFSDFVTVFSIPGTPAQTEYLDCNGSGVQLSAPAADMVSWSPDTGLNDASISDPFANPTETTTYTVTLTNADGCTTATEVTVTVADKPVFKDVTVTPASDCGVQDASIQISADGTGAIEFSIDGTNYGTDSLFTNLASGSYTVFVRNADDQCAVAYNGNPVIIEDLLAPSIDNVSTVDPIGCNPDGSITVTASGGEGILMYELTGQMSAGPQDSNVFSDLMEGNYTVIVTNENGTCAQTQDVTLVAQGDNLAVQAPVSDQELCVSSTSSVSITLNQDIASFNISGGSFSNETVNGNTLTFDVSANMGANNFTVDFTSVVGCTVAEAFVVTGVAEPVPSFSNSSTLCVDGNITLNYNGNGAGQITWDIADASIANGNLNSTPLVVSFASQGAKQVCVTMDENGCQVQTCQSITITDFDPQASFNTSDPTCGNNDGSIDLNDNGNYTYSWTGPGVNDPSLEDQTGLLGGTYFVEITDPGSGCSAQEQVFLDIPTTITVVLTGEDASDCIGNSGTGSITAQVSGDTGDFVYELVEGGDVISTQNSTLNVFTFENLAPGAYSVQVTLNGSCTDDEMIAIQSNSTTLSATSTSEAAECGLGNGSISVNISGGSAPYSYDIFVNNILEGSGVPVAANSISVSNLDADDNVQILVYDVTGCLVPITETIGSQPTDLSGVNASITSASCGGNDGTISLTGLPNGSLVAWVNKLDNPTLQIGLGNELEGISAGVYCAQILTASGCTEELNYTVGTADVEINIDSFTDATCGNDDGSVTFTVTGITDFAFEIPGSQIDGFGSAGAPVTVNGLGAGEYVVIVEDLVAPNCTAFESFETGDQFPASAVVTVIPSSASECGISDGTIDVSINNDVAYTLSTDLGTAPGAPFIGNITVSELYIGDVMLTLTEEATGCTTEIPVSMPQDFAEPDVMGNLAGVTSFTCPDEMGSIESTALPMEIFEMDGMTPVGDGMTPEFDLAPGTYIVSQTLGACNDEETIVIDGPDAFVVTETVSLETCVGLDGGIDINVSGGNGDYTFEWSNGDTSEDLLFVSAGTYTVTITDVEGCTYVQEVNVDSDCGDPCDDIFLVDTFLIELQGDNNKICLPTEYADLSIFDLSLNNENYAEDLGICSEFTNFYGYGLLLTLGTPPYQLQEWTYRGVKAPEYQFETIQELVDYMNLLDTYGNWGVNMAQSSISGGEPNSTYGTLVLSHVASATTLNLQVNTVSVDRPSIVVDDAPYHVFVAQDPINVDCADTLYINLSNSGPDTIYVEVHLGETVEDICLSTIGLPGTPETLTNVCQSSTYNAQLISSGDPCLSFYGISEGTDTYCMEICDDLGNCIEVTVIVEVTDDGEFEIFNGFSPNEDGINDYFRIKGIERYPENQLTVFNRWGNRIYSQKRYTNQNPWTAEYRNTYLASGSYFYILEVEMDGKKEVFSGLVEVRR